MATEAESLEQKFTKFMNVVERQRGKLMQLARRTTGRPEEAEDIVQEGFLRAFKALSNFRGDAQIDSWVYAIVRNTAREYIRNQGGRIAVSIDSAQEEWESAYAHECTDSGESPEESFERRELVGILNASIHDLTTTSKLALQMCVLQEQPHHLVASELNISISSVKSRVFNGKRKLKMAMHRRMSPMER